MTEFSPYILNSCMVFNKEELNTYKNIYECIHNNTGNSYITYGLIKSLYGKLVNYKHLNSFWYISEKDREKKLDEINSSSHVFLILQDFIRPKEFEIQANYKALINLINKIKVPVIVPNIGAGGKINDTGIHERLSENLRNMLYTISEHSNYIGVRGAYTQEILDKIGIKNTIITGCPSYFETGRNRIISKHKNISTNDILYSYPFTMSNIQGHSVLQGDFEADIIKAIIGNGTSIINESKNLSIINAYMDKTYHYFTNISDWKSYLNNFKIFAGMRVHGSIIAMNQGLNPIIFIRDIRSKEMMEYFKIPYFSPDDTSKNILELFEKCDYSEANNVYNKLFENWVDFLHKNDCLMYYENPEINNISEFHQPKSIDLYTKTINKEDIIIEMLNKQKIEVNQQLNKIYKMIEYTNKKLEEKEQKLSLIQKIFSVRNENNHKVIRILGIKIKLDKKAKNHAAVERERERERERESNSLK